MQYNTPISQGNHHEIHERDILCSKDKSLSSHPGNRLFREHIEDAKEIYRQARDKASKMKITKQIVERLQSDHGCRFVKFDIELCEWVEVTRIEARDKVGHALRFSIKAGRASNKTKKPEKQTKKRKSQECSSGMPTSPTQPTCAVSSAVSSAASVKLFPRKANSTPSISLEKIESAKSKLDQIFERQLQLLQLMQTTMTEDRKGSFPTTIGSSSDDDSDGDSGMVPETIVFEPLDLSNAKDTADYFAEGDLDFLTDDSESSDCQNLDLDLDLDLDLHSEVSETSS